jgi:hypothetical protein
MGAGTVSTRQRITELLITYHPSPITPCGDGT